MFSGKPHCVGLMAFLSKDILPHLWYKTLLILGEGLSTPSPEWHYNMPWPQGNVKAQESCTPRVENDIEVLLEAQGLI